MVEKVPVKEGEIHEVKILSVGEKGDGIAKVNGFVLFVPETKQKELVKIKVTKVLAKVGFAKVIERLESLKPQKSNRFMQISSDELNKEEVLEEINVEDSDDFGADIEDDGYWDSGLNISFYFSY